MRSLTAGCVALVLLHSLWLYAAAADNLLGSPAATIEVDLKPVCQGEGDDRRCGYINSRNQVVIPIQSRFKQAGQFSEGLASVLVSEPSRQHQLWGEPNRSPLGFIDATGALVIPAKFYQENLYSGGPEFHNGLAEVELSRDSEGIIDRQGRVLLVCGPAEGTTAIFRSPRDGFRITLRGDCMFENRMRKCEQRLDNDLRFDGRTILEQSYSDVDRGVAPVHVALPLMCDLVRSAP